MFRVEGGIPPLVELLEFNDTKVQRAAAGALRTLAFQNAENKNQVVDFAQQLTMAGSFVIVAYKNENCRLFNAMRCPLLY
ncbi:ARM repeat protein interacting WITH ABF2 protein [Trifolium medium]|uniref:ARM repeat protein interacting WITH ABF2 protein n=1 Tax=Trifolium medium TaxID=97028 RepID=A0A392STU3_9FABA|nr:ARM repeat protein interacting WITH ABF2 protein [Trifolium medium]